MQGFIDEFKSFLYDAIYIWSFNRTLDELKAYKNRFIGQRCFILGGGPSLEEVDLSKLQNEQVFVCNHFIKSEDLKSVGSFFYCASDPNFYRSGIDYRWVSALSGCREAKEIFLSYRASAIRSILKKNMINPIYLRYQPKKVWETGQFNTDCEGPLFSGDTVIIDFCIPLAKYMGFSSIYLVGVDCNYQFDKAGEVKYGFNLQGPIVKRSPNQYLTGSWVNNVIASYAVVQEKIDCVQIFDCSIDGNLKIFKKFRFEEIF